VTLPADRWGDAVLLRAFRPQHGLHRLRHRRRADARPNWREMQASWDWQRLF